MTPAELRAVAGSWEQLRDRRPGLLGALAVRLGSAGVDTGVARERAAWLVGAVEELVELLPAPSALAERARELGETWPDPLRAPSFRVEGAAWLAAAGDCGPCWSPQEAEAWRQAWFLLSEVLAVEALSPFADEA